MAKDLKVSDLFELLWNGQGIILASILVFTVHGIYLATSADEIFRSSATLVRYHLPISSDSKFSSVPQFGSSLLTGANSSGERQHRVVDRKLKSRLFASRFISRHELSDILFLSDSLKKGEINNIKLMGLEDLRQLRVSSVNHTDHELYQRLHSRLHIQSDFKDGILIISFDHESRHAARDILNLLITDIELQINEDIMSEINDISRELEVQMNINSDVNVRELSSMVLQQHHTLGVLVPTLGYFPFIQVSDPYIPEFRVSPNRTFLIGRGLIIGSVVGFFILLLAQAFKVYKHY